MKPHELRIQVLATLGWTIENTSGRHTVCGEQCRWIHGQISGIEWSAWMSEVSGMVYFHTSPAIDKTFDEFCKLVENGWPKVVVIPKTRSLFGED